MKVTCIASTYFEEMPNSVKDTAFGRMHGGPPFQSGDRLAHFAGRSCYQAWEMPRAATSTDEGYLANIISQGHFSVLEHASATFYVEGVSRNLTHELIRHRHLSYSELSQRYINMEDAVITVPPAIDSLDNWMETVGKLGRTMSDAITHYEEIVATLEEAGIKGKKAREAARAVLPGATETRVVVTGNYRAWRDMLTKRYSVHADAEIRELATEILRQLKDIAPASFQDFPDSPFE